VRAILLAAGLGTRLRPITDTIPKCLVPIHGKPLLQIWLERLTAVGIGPFLINTHYLSKQVENFIEQSEFSNQVELVYEPELLGTAGTLLKNIGFFQGGDGLLIHADNYCLADFNAFLEAHENRPKVCIMTMMTFRTDNPSSCGIIELDKQGIVVGFHEKVVAPPGNLANAAIYILTKDFISILKSQYYNAKDVSTELIPRLTGRIYSYYNAGDLVDIGTIENYEKVNNAVL
jgi:mannose-1-phosphate guanylyltransferase